MTFCGKFIASAKSALVWDALSAADVIAVGFSGGADSTVLLTLLCECFPDADVRAIHVNHMIRGEAADLRGVLRETKERSGGLFGRLRKKQPVSYD